MLKLEVVKEDGDFDKEDSPFLSQPSGAGLCFMPAKVKVMAIMMRKTQEL